jgi:hypothetical protein
VQVTSTIGSRQIRRRCNGTCLIRLSRAGAIHSSPRRTGIACHTRHWTANLGATYVLETSVGAWTLAANFLHDSGWHGEPDNQLRQPAYNLVNASLDWHLGNKPYSLELWGRNLGNELVHTAIAGNAVTSLSHICAAAYLWYRNSAPAYNGAEAIVLLWRAAFDAHLRRSR